MLNMSYRCYIAVYCVYFCFFLCEQGRNCVAVAYSQMTYFMSVFVQVDTKGRQVVGFHTSLLRNKQLKWLCCVYF